MLKIIGREGSSIKKGGKLINLLEIENKIRDNCQVEDVAALAINDKIYGKNYNLFIVPKQNLIQLYKQVYFKYYFKIRYAKFY